MEANRENGGPDTGDAAAGTVTVRLLDVPIELHRRTFAAISDLQRELTLIVTEPDAGEVPVQVVEIAREFRDLLGPIIAGDRDVIDAAQAEGRAHVELRYTISTEVAPVVRDVLARIPPLLGEVDRFCHEAGELLSLAPDPEQLAYRRWVFTEPVRQLDGAEPTPWPGA